MPHTDTDGDDEPWTFAVDSDGDLIMTENQTVKTVHGKRATIQSLKVALATYKGTDPRDPKFGLQVFQAVESNQSLRREVRKTLEYDDYRHDRVSAIRSINIIEGPSRRAKVEAAISLMNEPQDLTLVFDLFNASIGVTGGSL